MAVPAETTDSLALAGMRRRGQFLIAGLLWAAVGGLVLLVSAYLVVLYHYVLSGAEWLRGSLGMHAPESGVDVFLLSVMAAGPGLFLMAAAIGWMWYRSVWNRKLREVWPDVRDRRRFAGWQRLPRRADPVERARRAEYLSKLQQTNIGPEEYPARAEEWLAELEKDIAERALATGLIVGVSQSRLLDLFTIFTATLELQLHVLTTLGKRPSWHTWRMLIHRCGASLFVNSYLNRQDALMLNLLIKKAGMGLHAAGDVMESGAQHLAESDIDLDDALGLQHSGMIGIATKSIELGASMAMTVGQVGLHTLGILIESVGDELAQGALAAGIIYYHGMSLAADTLALDRVHRLSPEMNRNLRTAIWKMGEVAGSILLDFIRQRRNAFREKRQQVVRSIPRTAYDKIQKLFGRRAGPEVIIDPAPFGAMPTEQVHPLHEQ